MSEDASQLPPRPKLLTAAQRRLLERMLAPELPAAVPTIAPGMAARGHARLSSAQLRMWFFDQVQPGSALYTITGVARLRGTLDIAALRRTLDEVVRRHEVLRTTFHSDGTGPWSVVGPPVPVPVPVADLSAVAAAERPGAVAELLAAEGNRPFDLSRDLMLRARLIRLGPDEYLLHLAMHHIAADGWSLGVLLAELGALYPAFHRGQPAALAELAVQYADYAAWRHDRAGEPEHEKLLQAWTDRLAGATALDLPTDRPRQETGSFAGGTVPCELPADLTARVKELADAERATPYMVLLAALAAVLGRWSGELADLIVGCAVAGRNRSEIEPLIGFFVNTLPLRISLAGRPSFREAVRRVRTACLDGYAGQDVPFEQIIERLRPDREPGGRVPLVRHMLVLHNTPRPRLALPDLEVEVLPLQTATAKFELQLELAPIPDGGLSGWMEYSRDLFDEVTVGRMTDGLRLLLADGLDRPDVPVDELRLLTDADRRAVVGAWSGAGPAAVATGCLHHLFEAAADQAPDAVALTHAAGQLTYGELEDWSNRLANHLISLGVEVEDVVGIRLPRSTAAVAAMLATLKAGAAYLPLDPSHPPQRVRQLAADAGARLVLTADDLAPAAPATRPVVPVRPANRAYVLFTSGSTGRPKGAVNEHAAVSNRVCWMQHAYGLEPGEAVLHKTPLGFDVSGWEWLWPLAAGGRVVIADEDGRRDPGAIARLIRDNAVRTCHFVPSMLTAFLADPAAGDCAGVLRRVICSGEELPPELVRRFSEVLPGTELHNLYGPTEAAIDVTAWPVTGTAGGARVPIGRPIPGAQIYILDDHMIPVPPGMPGELFIGGLAVGRGYQGRPGLTAQRFVPSPFLPGGRLYRTGDRARWTGDGIVDFLGRRDSQVKVRGQRIEPGEIESVLAGHPAVERAVVTPFLAGDGDLRLAAYVSLSEDVDVVDDGGGGDGAQAPAVAQDAVTAHVRRWEAVFDDVYRGSDSVDPSLNLAGWTDSSTGEPIPAAEMLEWVNEAASRILALRPSRVLEIGCGTGLLLRRIAAHCEYYCGTDISAEVIGWLRAELGDDPAVELANRPADDFSGLAGRRFDTVILNSVVQYFPDLCYLEKVVRGALAVLRPGGRLFVGDVRDLRLLTEFHCSVQARRLPPETSVAALRRIVRGQVAAEEELLVHPALFEEVAGPGSTVLLAKSSPYRNELTRFRYDVIITAGRPATADGGAGPAGAWSAWTPGLRPSGEAEGWLAVPDARLCEDLLAARLMDAADIATVGELRRAAEAVPAAALEPAAIAVPPGVRLLPRLGAQTGLLDLEFCRADGSVPGHPGQPRPADGILATDPRASTRRRLAVAALREHLGTTLPDYMIPASVIVVDQWPVGANGKLDRASLPAPDWVRPALATGFVAPRTETERAVARIWREALNLDRVGVHDDFFALGGHSLLAVQLVSRLQAQFGRELTLSALLRAPTVATLTAQLEAAPAGSPIRRAARKSRDRVPAPSPTQQGAGR